MTRSDSYLLEEGRHDINLLDVLRLQEENNKLEKESRCLNIRLCLGLVLFIAIISFIVIMIFDYKFN